jgi:glycosyltransferase involved in cell wall biosynthesis
MTLGIDPFERHLQQMKISVITVCFDSSAHIATALRSVDAQTYPDLEHIIVDGASRDDTLRIVESFPQPWRRVMSEPDDGIYDAMNKGILLAIGDVIGFINSDDFYASSDVLDRVAAAFEDPTVDACYGDLCYVRQNDRTKVIRYWRSADFRSGAFRKGWVPPHPTLFLRRRVLDQYGAFDLNYRIAADFELMARLIEKHRIRTVYIPEVLVKMRLGGTTNRNWSNIVQQNREIWHALKAHRLQPNALSFLLGKIAIRCRQFLIRPS